MLDDVTVETERRPRFLQRIGFPGDLAPFREGVIVAAIVAPLLTGIYKLYNAPWKVPWSYAGDSLAGEAYVKSIMENGWYTHSPRLGAPFTADWRDFPLGGENVHWFSMKLISMVTGNYALTTNLYFILGFFLIAFSAHFVARYLGFNAATATVIAIAFAFLPYHGYRGEGHLIRSAYYVVPFAVLLVLWMANYASSFFRDDDVGPHLRRGRFASALVIAIVLGASDTYNAAFMVSLLAIVAVVEAVRDRRWAPVVLAAVLAGATFGSLLLNQAPYLLARFERGNNTVVANRPLSDQDLYGLRPVDLVLPAPGHRIKFLRHVSSTAEKGKVVPSESDGTPLGVLGAVGLLFSLGAALVFGLTGRRRGDPSASDDPLRTTRLAAQLGIINLAAIVIGTIGGFAFLIALAGYTTFRTWNRISLFIAFSSLLATGLLLERLFAFMHHRWKGRRTLVSAVIAGIVVVLCFGAALDQITPRFTFNYKSTEARFNVDDDFYTRLEASVPKGSMMFQLPFEPYPEVGTIGRMTDYQDFTGFLHTKSLRWNYAAMKGRPEGDWANRLSMDDPVAALADLAAVGYQGAVLDRTGFLDNAQNFLLKAQPYVGDPKLVSDDGRLLYLDLTGLRARLARELGADTVARAGQLVSGDAVQWTGVRGGQPICHGVSMAVSDPHAYVTLDNSTGRPLPITPSLQFQADPDASRVIVRGPGFRNDVPLRNGGGTWQPTITLPTGRSKISFATVGDPAAAADPGNLQLQILYPSFGPQFDSAAEAWAHKLGTTGCEVP